VLNSLRLERLPGPCRPTEPQSCAPARPASEPDLPAPGRSRALALLKAQS